MTTLLFAFSFHGAPRAPIVARAAVRLTTASSEPWQNLFVETDDGKGYVSSVLPAGPNASPDTPPLLLVPPIGVGITRTFFNRFMREWVEVGAPCEVHAPDLLGCGANWPRWPRKFYAPDDWAEQLDEYVRQNIARPVVVCTQGGLAPVALEMWRLRRGEEGGLDTTIAGVSFISPPLWQVGPPAPAKSRRLQRAFWLLAQSSVGGFFYRYLRGKDGERIRNFSERNLFSEAAAVDDEWVENCVAGAAQTRSRHAVYSYLCGTLPGGAWRDDRSHLLRDLAVPAQVLRGDSVPDAAERLEVQKALVPMASCCAVVPNSRAVLPWEAAPDTAKLVAEFLAANF